MRKGQKMPESARLTLVTRLKGNQYTKGKHWSNEHKEKIKNSNLGKKRSEITRNKMSKSRLGVSPWNKGKVNVYSKKTIEKFRLAHIGKKHSVESRRKRGLHWLGTKNPNYKHGKSKENSKRYGDLQYKLWRESVFERDDYTCQDCGVRGGYITAHHIKSWAHYPDLRLELSNGLTLCEECHKLTDNYKGRSKRKINKVIKIKENRKRKTIR